MCQQLVQFCSSSGRPLIYGGAALTLLLAGAISYVGHSNRQLYSDLDPSVAETHSLSYYLQLGAALYLILLSTFSCLTVYKEHKQSIRALTIISIINIILATVSILMIPGATELSGSFDTRLKGAIPLYDFSDKLPPPANRTLTGELSSGIIQAASGQERTKRLAGAPMNRTEATKLWDRLQNRGCCGLKNYTDWTEMLPKSCCGSPVEEGANTKCREVDSGHKCPCEEVIGSTRSQLLIVLILIALTNLYLSVVFGFNAYRTFYYDEANQNAYT